jgi:NAD+ diphosphatase
MTMTPLSVYLPFNVDCLRGEFAPAKRGGGPPAGTGRWLIVQDQKLLVEPDGDGFGLPAGATPEAPPRNLDGLGPRHWLGTWSGEPCWVAGLPKSAPVPEGLRPETLVPMQGTRLPDDLLTLGGMAMQLLYWESTSGHCPRCGAPTGRLEGEWGKRCEACRYEHYPHLHPAVIVLVRDGDRVLLARKAIWAPGRYALVAGFVDNGESLEGCVAREVKEGSGWTSRTSSTWAARTGPSPARS